MRYAPLPGVRINRNTCPMCGDYRTYQDIAEWWVSVSGYEHVEHKCLHCLYRWPESVKEDHPDLLRALKEETKEWPNIMKRIHPDLTRAIREKKEK